MIFGAYLGLFHLHCPLCSIPYPSTRVSRMYVCIYVAPFVFLLSYQLWNLKPFIIIWRDGANPQSKKRQVQIALFFCTNMKQKSPDKILILGFHVWFVESNNTPPEKTEVKSVPKNLQSCSWRLYFLIAINHHDWVFLLFLEMWQRHRKQIVLGCFAWILGGFLCTYVYALSGADEVSW
jgi:hypothetical protein